MKTIADRLKEAMEIRHLKQVDIVEQTGINKGALSSYISGKYEPKQNNIYLLAKALNVNELWLMGHDIPMERKYTLNNITPEYLQSNPKIKDALFDITRVLFHSYSPFNDRAFIDKLKDENISDEMKAKIYNDLYDQFTYDQEKNSLDLSIDIPFGESHINSEDIILRKYKALDEKGKHTVNTVLEMEYNRCYNDEMAVFDQNIKDNKMPYSKPTKKE